MAATHPTPWPTVCLSDTRRPSTWARGAGHSPLLGLRSISACTKNHFELLSGVLRSLGVLFIRQPHLSSEYAGSMSVKHLPVSRGQADLCSREEAVPFLVYNHQPCRRREARRSN